MMCGSQPTVVAFRQLNILEQLFLHFLSAGDILVHVDFQLPVLFLEVALGAETFAVDLSLQLFDKIEVVALSQTQLRDRFSLLA
jgi:hypothetical protein